MEEQQLLVDDDPLPIYYVSSDLGTGAFSRVWQEHEVSLSAPQPHLFPLLDHSSLAAASSTTESYMLDKHGCKDKEKNKEVGLISGTNFEDCVADDHSRVQKEIFHDQQQSLLPTSTSIRTQVNTMANSSSAQDIFLTSLLQVQLCMLDLQDQIDITETCHLQGREQQPETSPLYTPVDVSLEENHQELGENHQELEENHQELEEDHENDDICYSEVEDERVFWDNPLFNNSKALHLVGHSNQPSFPELGREDELGDNYKTETKGSNDILAQNVWDRNVNSTGKVVWHEITREESLEVLQIYEDEWEERAMPTSTRTRKLHLFDRCTQEAFLCSEDPQDNMTPCNSTPIVPEAVPGQETVVKDEGLLFSEIGLWSQLLIEDEESNHKPPPSPTSLESPPTLQLPESDESGEETILMPCHDQSMPVENQVDGMHMLCLGCQGKEDVGRRLPSEDRTEEINLNSQQNFPEIIVNQLDDVSTDMETSGSEEVTYVEAVSISQDAEAARCLAMKLFHLDGFQRSQVAAYLQKNNDFSAMVAEEYLALFDFTGKSLDVALRSLLQELVLTGETQERERVLFHFSKRFHNCNPKVFSSPDAVHTLTCALMLLNSDLHGQNIGKSMTSQEFINNLEGMNDGANFPRDMLKSLYQAIRVEKLEWAIREEKLSNALISRPESLLSVRKKSSPFLDIPPPDPHAPIYKQGMLYRKVHAYIDGKKTPWGKRGWKSFHTALKGMLLFFLKDEYRADFLYPEEVISVHHALAEKATDYTKRPNVFRLQTADWRVFLFQAQTAEEMNSWISRINVVAAMFSSPPFPAAVGSQKRFYRPILPSTQCKLDLEEQLQSHETLMDRFTDDLTEHQRNLPDSKSKTRDWEDYHLREEYLRYEKLRYETYVKLLVVRMESGCEELHTFESRLTEPDGGQEESNGLKRSYSSPSLNPDNFPVAVKVKRNISERRTYRRIIPKRNKNLV